MNALAPTQVATADRTSSIAPLQITPVNAVVPQKSLTFSAIEASVEAVTSAESRAAKVLGDITRPFGKDGKNWFTDFAGSRVATGVATAVGLGVAYAIFDRYFPGSADYYYRSSYHGWSHRATDSWYYKDAALAAIPMMIAGFGAWLGAEVAIGAYAKREKRKMTDALLQGRHMEPFVELLNAAQERPLERAAIAKVAREHLSALEEPRQIYCEPQVKAVLNRSIEDEGLGDAQAREQMQKHRAVIDAVRTLETKTDEVDSHISALSATIAALPENERRAVAQGVYDRLFANYRPRHKHITFPEAQRLTKLLT